MGRGSFFGGKGHPVVKYRDTVQSSVQKSAEPIQMLFGLWVRIDPGNRVLDGPEVLGDVAMATNFWLSLGYNFGCIIASDPLFDSRGVGFWGQAIR